jgi:hypothetical protein
LLSVCEEEKAICIGNTWRRKSGEASLKSKVYNVARVARVAVSSRVVVELWSFEGIPNSRRRKR